MLHASGHKCHLLHNLHAMQENLHRRNREKIVGPLPRTPTRRRKYMTDAYKPVARNFNLPSHSHHNITICGYPYTTGTQNTAKISSKNSFFNWVHSLHRELINASHSTNLFTNSCDHISTNGKGPLHSHINHNTPQFLYSL